MSIRVKVLKSINEIEEHLWDAVVSKDSILKTHRFLNAVEHSGINDCRFRYFIFLENDIIVANASLFSMTFCLDIIAPTYIKKTCDRLRRFFPNFFKVKLLGCGNPVATCTNGISVLEARHYEKVIKALSGEMYAIARQEDSHCILFKEFNNYEARIFDLFLKKEFIRVPSLPTSFIDVYWKSFDEYVGSMRKRYRALLRKDLVKVHDQRITVEVLNDFGDYANDLWALYMNVYVKAEVKFEQLTPDFFKNINKYMPNECKVLLIKLHDQILSFELVIEDTSTLRPLYLGLNYEMNEMYSLYFNNIYQIIKYGIERNKSSIELGQTSYYPKLKAGARVEPLYLYINFCNPVLRPIFNHVARLLFPVRQYESKNIFKNK